MWPTSILCDTGTLWSFIVPNHIHIQQSDEEISQSGMTTRSLNHEYSILAMLSLHGPSIAPFTYSSYPLHPPCLDAHENKN